MDDTGMRVAQLWQYPVKSLAGRPLERADVDHLGVRGDRGFGLVDLDTGLVLTARRVPELLFASPVVDGDGDGADAIRVCLPDGTITNDEAVLSDWLGRRVQLRRAQPRERGRYEIARNDDRPDGEWVRWEGPEGVFHDSTRTRVSVVSKTAVADSDPRRFRANVVVSGGDERDLLGLRVRLGSAELEVVKEIDRCVVVTRPQPGLERDKDVLLRVNQQRSGNLGVGALVATPGTVELGDALLATS